MTTNRLASWSRRTALVALLGLVPVGPAWAQSNLLVNGSFADGLDGWTPVVVVESWGGAPKFEIHEIDPNCVPGPHWWLAINAWSGADGYVEQSVELPDGPALLRLTTWGNLDPTVATISVVDEAGVEHVLDQYIGVPIHAEPEPGVVVCTGNVPEDKEFDLEAFGGQTIALRLRGSSTGISGTYANFDEVEILAEERPAFEVRRLVASGEADGRITPADAVRVAAEIEKVLDVETSGLTVAIEDTLLTADAVDAPGAPAGLGTFTVEGLDAQVADETNADVADTIVLGQGELPLGSVVVHLTWSQDGEPKSSHQTVAVEDAAGATWSVRYPDYGTITGDPPGTSSELAYYRFGNVPYEGPYLDDPNVRKFALVGARFVQGVTPDDPGEAAEGVAGLLLQHMTFKWGVESTPTARQVAQRLETGGKVTDVPCIGFSLTYGAFARTLGLRARELDMALLFNAGFGIGPTAVMWMQHATDQVWFDGRWNYFDLGYASAKKLPEPVRDPCFLLTTDVGWWPYNAVQAWYRPSPLHEGNFMIDIETGKPLVRGWRFLFGLTRSDCRAGAPRGNLDVRVYSPVTLLYVDDAGRRLGAEGPIVEADRWTPDRQAPLLGGGSVWEVPGGFYFAPGTVVAPNEMAPADTYALHESIGVPLDEVGESFAVRMRAVETGHYTLVVSQTDDATPEAERTLYTVAGTATEGQPIVVDFTVEATPEGELSVEPRVAEPGRCGCSPGAGPAAWGLLPLAALAGARRRRRVATPR